MFGYLRYDTAQELKMINDLYEQELRVYKNFFQPVMKLKEKIREGGASTQEVRHCQDTIPKVNRV